jgi:TusA-related sulfurtransferase
MISPFSLLKASNTFRSLGQGDELEILCNDPESLTDLIKVIPSDSCELVSMKDLSGKQ